MQRQITTHKPQQTYVFVQVKLPKYQSSKDTKQDRLKKSKSPSTGNTKINLDQTGGSYLCKPKRAFAF